MPALIVVLHACYFMVSPAGVFGTCRWHWLPAFLHPQLRWAMQPQYASFQSFGKIKFENSLPLSCEIFHKKPSPAMLRPGDGQRPPNLKNGLGTADSADHADIQKVMDRGALTSWAKPVGSASASLSVSSALSAVPISEFRPKPPGKHVCIRSACMALPARAL